MALLESSMLRGLLQTPTRSMGSLSTPSHKLPRARPARVTMGMGLKHPHSPNDPFLANLAAAASTEMGKAQLAGASGVSDGPPLLDVLTNPVMMAAPAQVERSSGYNEHRPRRPPPDLPSLLLNSRIVYIGMPLVPAVTELVIAELLYLQYSDPRQPIYVYINSTGTSRADGETVGLETEGFAIYDTFMNVRNQIQTVAVGAAIGQACLLLAAGDKGMRYMMPHATAMIQQPRLPSTGQMSAIDVHIRAKELINNRDTLVELLAKHTGNVESSVRKAALPAAGGLQDLVTIGDADVYTDLAVHTDTSIGPERRLSRRGSVADVDVARPVEKVAKVMERPFYMNPKKAVDFGVADKILWRGQEAMVETMNTEEWDKGAGIRVVERPASYGAGDNSA